MQEIDFFRSRIDAMINLNDPLAVLAARLAGLCTCSGTSDFASWREAQMRRLSHSFFKLLNNDCAIALSQQFPRRLMLGTRWLYLHQQLKSSPTSQPPWMRMQVMSVTQTWSGRAKACNTLLAASITGLAQVAVNARTAINALAVLKGISAVIIGIHLPGYVHPWVQPCTRNSHGAGCARPGTHH